jgi:orotate phosphoribosyltransferase
MTYGLLKNLVNGEFVASDSGADINVYNPSTDDHRGEAQGHLVNHQHLGTCQEMFAIVKDIAATGMSILLVEQHVKNALEVADFGTIIDGGITRASGSATELRKSDVVRESYLGH